MSSSTAKITKAKLKDDLFLEVEYTEEVMQKGVPTGTRTVGETLTVPVHPDLVTAFKPLAGHLAMICDEIPAKKLAGFLDTYQASGFSLKGEDSTQGVTVMGGKRNKHGFIMLNSPFQRFEGSKYAGISELGLVIEGCIKEVKAYLFDGKKAPDPQIDMFAPPADDLVAGEPGSEKELQELADKANKGMGSKGKLKAIKKQPDSDGAAEPAATEKPKRTRVPKKKPADQDGF